MYILKEQPFKRLEAYLFRAYVLGDIYLIDQFYSQDTVKIFKRQRIVGKFENRSNCVTIANFGANSVYIMETT